MAKKFRGFTLIELMVTIAVLAIIIAIALPAFGAFFEKARLRGAADDLVSQVALARAEAMRTDRNVTVSVVLSADGWCSGGRSFMNAATDTVGLVRGDGEATCDCSDPDDAPKCFVAGNASLVSSSNYNSVLMGADSAAQLRFDSKTGTLADLETHTISLASEKSPSVFGLDVEVSPMGHARVCVPSGFAMFGGYKSC